jgi:NADPH-dependent 2,4-dienoyl-CoA reductase/sulfur reductase-like enzyme
MKVVIVGGVAGGASCAARLRRLEETAHILMAERSLYGSPAGFTAKNSSGGTPAREQAHV